MKVVSGIKRLIWMGFWLFPLVFVPLPSLVAWNSPIGVSVSDSRLDLVIDRALDRDFVEKLVSACMSLEDIDELWVNLSVFEPESHLLPDDLKDNLIGKLLMDMDIQLKKDVAEALVNYLPVDVEKDIDFRAWISPREARIEEKDGFFYVLGGEFSVHLSLDYDGVDVEEVERRLTEKVNSSQEYRPLRELFEVAVLVRHLRENYDLSSLYRGERWDIRERVRDYVGLYGEDLVGGISLSGYKEVNETTDIRLEGAFRLRGESLPYWAADLIDYVSKEPVVVSDLDQTLIDDDIVPGKLAEEIATFLQSGGRLFVLTASPIEKIERFLLPGLRKDVLKADGYKNLVFITDSGLNAWGLSEDGGLKKLYGRSIVEEMGQDTYKRVLEILSEAKTRFQLRPIKGALVLVELSRIVFCPWGYGFSKKERLQLEEELGQDRDTLRKRIAEFLRDSFERENLNATVSIAGKFSLDICLHGGKAYGLKKILDLWGIDKQDIIYIGDSFYEGGNDFPVLEMGIRCINVGKDGDGLYVGGSVEGAREFFRVLNAFSLRRKAIEESALLEEQRLLKEGRLLEAIDLLSDLPEGIFESAFTLSVAGIRAFIRAREDEVLAFVGWAKETGFGLQPFSYVLFGGGTSVRYFWRPILRRLDIEDSILYGVHNVDDGGSSLSIMRLLEDYAGEGYINASFVQPFGDAMNALTGFLSGPLSGLFSDSMRIYNKALFESALRRLIDLRRTGADFQEEDVIRILGLMVFLEDRDKDEGGLIPEGNVSLRNALLESICLANPRASLDANLDAASILLGFGNKRVRFINENKITMYAKRLGWTIRVLTEKGPHYFGLFKRDKKWFLRRYEYGKWVDREILGETVLMDGVKLDILDDHPCINVRFVLDSGGLDPRIYDIKEKRVLLLSRDGSGRRRDLEASEKDIPVFEVGNNGVYIIPDTIVMQTNITETFSPLPIEEIGLLKVDTKDPKEIFNRLMDFKLVKRIEGRAIDISSISKDGFIAIGPGSFFSSILVNFEVRSFVEALKAAKVRGVKVLLFLGAGVDNEVVGMSIGDMLKQIERVSGYDISDLITAVVVPRLGRKNGKEYRVEWTGPRDLASPSLGGKSIYGIIDFRDGERKYWEKKGIVFLPVKVEWREVESRFPGKTIKRIFYSIEDAVSVLSRFLGVGTRVDEESNRNRLERQLGQVYDEVRVKKGITAGIYEARKFLQERDLSCDREDVFQGYNQDINRIRALLEGVRIKENVPKALEMIRLLWDRYPALAGPNLLLAEGVILEQHNLVEAGDELIREALSEFLRTGEPLDGELLLWLAGVSRDSEEDKLNQTPHKAGGIVFFAQ